MNFHQITEALGFFEDRLSREVSKDPVCVTGRPSFIVFERASLLQMFAFNDKRNLVVGQRRAFCDLTREPIAEENIRSVKLFQDVFVICAYEFFQSNKINVAQKVEADVLVLYTAMTERQRALALEALTFLGTNQEAILLQRERDKRGTGLLEDEIKKLKTWGIPDLEILAAVEKRENKALDQHPAASAEVEVHQPDDEDAELARALELSLLASQGRPDHHDDNDDDDDFIYRGMQEIGAVSAAALAAVSRGEPSRSKENKGLDQHPAASAEPVDSDEFVAYISEDEAEHFQQVMADREYYRKQAALALAEESEFIREREAVKQRENKGLDQHPADSDELVVLNEDEAKLFQQVMDERAVREQYSREQASHALAVERQLAVEREAVKKREHMGLDQPPAASDEEVEKIYQQFLREVSMDSLRGVHQPDDEDAELERALEVSRLESQGRPNHHNDDDYDDFSRGMQEIGAAAAVALAAVNRGEPSRSNTITTTSSNNNNNNANQLAAVGNGLSVQEKLRMDAAVLAAIALQRKNSNTPKFFVYDNGKIQLADRAPEGYYAANCHLGTQFHEQNQQIFYKPGGQAADELFGRHGFVHRLVKPFAEASTKKFENMYRDSSARIQAGATYSLSSSANAATASPVVAFSLAVRGRSVQDKLKVDAPVLSALALERKNSKTPKFYVFESGQIILTGQRPPNYYSVICHLGTEPHEQNQEIFYMPAGPQRDPASQLFGHHGFVHRLAKPFPNAATNEKFVKLYETAAVPLRENAVIDRQEYAALFK